MIDEVWAALMDFFNAPRIGRREGLLAIRQTSTGSLGVGSTYSERRVILGFETRLTARITEWDLPHLVASTMEGRQFRSFVSRFTLESGPDGTKLVSSIDMELRPALKLLWPIIGPFIRHRRSAAFRDSKALLAILDAKSSEAEADANLRADRRRAAARIREHANLGSIVVSCSALCLMPHSSIMDLEQWRRGRIVVLCRDDGDDAGRRPGGRFQGESEPGLNSTVTRPKRQPACATGYPASKTRAKTRSAREIGSVWRTGRG